MPSRHATGIGIARYWGRATSTERRGPSSAGIVDPGAGGWTRFAPAPTGYLHLGHVANALWVWGLAGITDGRVLLRIEDHDRERYRSEYDAAILEDIAWLGFVPDAGPVRQREDSEPYAAALDRLRADGLAYACDCTRSTFAAWTAERGKAWRGPGCPGGCRTRNLADDDALAVRVALGDGEEPWDDLLLGSQTGAPTETGDVTVRDRRGNWTYAFAVVVDDLHESISLVIRGEDLARSTPAQLRLGRLLGRAEPPAFAHHPLIRKPGGAKLSKADGDAGVRERRTAGQAPEEVIGSAARAIGLIQTARRIPASAARDLVSGWLNRV